MDVMLIVDFSVLLFANVNSIDLIVTFFSVFKVIILRLPKSRLAPAKTQVAGFNLLIFMNK